MVDEAEPLDHEYVVNGVLVDNTEKFPAQYVDAPVITGTGFGFTVTVIASVPIQPLAFVPVTMYVVVDAGVIEKLLPIPSPLSHV